jgi:predicted enzyme related to lactoylglutathione lyase
MARINLVESPARDLPAAKAFYRTVFGWVPGGAGDSPPGSRAIAG